MNTVQLVGRLVAEPTINTTNGGMTIARFTVACDRRVKQDGQPSADFPSCVSFGKTAEFVEKYFHKGSRIGLVGRLQTGYFEKNGQKIYTTDVIVENVEFVDSKGNASAPTEDKKSDDFMNVPDGLEDELPFN